MEPYSKNGIVKFDNGKSYFILDKKLYLNRTFLNLATTSEPLEILFAEVMPDLTLKPVYDQDLKINLLKLFSEQTNYA